MSKRQTNPAIQRVKDLEWMIAEALKEQRQVEKEIRAIQAIASRAETEAALLTHKIVLLQGQRQEALRAAVKTNLRVVA